MDLKYRFRSNKSELNWPVVIIFLSDSDRSLCDSKIEKIEFALDNVETPQKSTEFVNTVIIGNVHVMLYHVK